MVVKISQFERNQCLQRLMDSGAAKTVRDMDFIRALEPLIQTVLNLPLQALMWSDVEARRKGCPVIRQDGTTYIDNQWVVALVGNLVPSIEFGEGVNAEQSAKMVADLLNAVRMFRQKVM